jgi:hypothetical protein
MGLLRRADRLRSSQQGGEKMSAVIWVPLWLISIVVGGLAGKAKGYPYRGFVLGAVLSILGLIIILLMRPAGQSVHTDWEQIKRQSGGDL